MHAACRTGFKETEMVCDILIVGGDGDLAYRKLYPALYHLDMDGCLSSCLRIVSVSRTALTAGGFSDKVGAMLRLAIGEEPVDESVWERFSARLSMSYKSENLEEIDGDMLRFEDAHQQFDFMGKYYLQNGVHFYFNVINITDEPMYQYFDRRNVNAQYEEYGRSIEFGVTYSF